MESPTFELLRPEVSTATLTTAALPADVRVVGFPDLTRLQSRANLRVDYDVFGALSALKTIDSLLPMTVGVTTPNGYLAYGAHLCVLLAEVRPTFDEVNERLFDVEFLNGWSPPDAVFSVIIPLFRSMLANLDGPLREPTSRAKCIRTLWNVGAHIAFLTHDHGPAMGERELISTTKLVIEIVQKLPMWPRQGTGESDTSKLAEVYFKVSDGALPSVSVDWVSSSR